MLLAFHRWPEACIDKHVQGQKRFESDDTHEKWLTDCDTICLKQQFGVAFRQRRLIWHAFRFPEMAKSLYWQTPRRAQLRTNEADVQSWVVGWKLSFPQKMATWSVLPQAIVPKFKLKFPPETSRTISSQLSDGREVKLLCIWWLKTGNGVCPKNACSRWPRVILCGDWFDPSQ